MKNIPVFAIIALVASSALASEPQLSNTNLDEVFITNYAFSGDGCPDNDVVAHITPDKQVLSILFGGAFFAFTDNVTLFERRSCNIAVTLNVPEHQSVALVGYDYRGEHQLSPGSTAVFLTEYFFAGEEGKKTEEFFFFGDDPYFFIHDEVQTGEQLQSECGKDVNLRANTSINVGGPNGAIFLDSVDLDTGLEYQLLWNPC